MCAGNSHTDRRLQKPEMVGAWVCTGESGREWVLSMDNCSARCAQGRYKIFFEVHKSARLLVTGVGGKGSANKLLVLDAFI